MENNSPKKKELHIIWILDCSSGMVNGKLQALNTAIREFIPGLADIADENNAEILMGVVGYGTGARWHLEPTPFREIFWLDLFDFGRADAGAAFRLVESYFWRLRYGNIKNKSSMIIWVASSKPTDQWKEPLEVLSILSDTLGAVRLAISIGDKALNDSLQEFIGDSKIRLLQGHEASTLTRYIKWYDEDFHMEEGEKNKNEERLLRVLEKFSKNDQKSPITRPNPLPNKKNSSNDVW